ncbi:MAG: prepilin-type N-terminal cleavage/methylation domain-containing protein [Verrucomicrobiota bacterium]
MIAPASPPLRRQAGFTLIELIVVISIVLVLVGLTIGGVSIAQQRTAAGKTETQLKAIQMGLQAYYRDQGEFPYPAGTFSSLPPQEYLYAALTGDEAPLDGLTDTGQTAYLPEIVPGEAPKPAYRGGNLGLVVGTLSNSFQLVDGWSQPWNYQNRENQSQAYPGNSFGVNDETNRGSYLLFSYAGKDDHAEEVWIKNW